MLLKINLDVTNLERQATWLFINITCQGTLSLAKINGTKCFFLAQKFGMEEIAINQLQQHKWKLGEKSKRYLGT